MARFRVVQPWGERPRAAGDRQSEHATIAEAFAAIDATSAAMMRTGAPSDAIELLVVNESGDVLPRPDMH
jgi:hypothetical protein